MLWHAIIGTMLNWCIIAWQSTCSKLYVSHDLSFGYEVSCVIQNVQIVNIFFFFLSSTTSDDSHILNNEWKSLFSWNISQHGHDCDKSELESDDGMVLIIIERTIFDEIHRSIYMYMLLDWAKFNQFHTLINVQFNSSVYPDTFCHTLAITSNGSWCIGIKG